MSLPEHESSPVPRVVLDNNVVLDWLLFRDPNGLAVGAAVTSRKMQWKGTAEMRAELSHVLGRGELDGRKPDLPAIWATWSAHCMEVPTPLQSSARVRFRCTDTDDQKFIDLAANGQVRWLLSRDRAVLKLARRLKEVGVEVLTPSAWVARYAKGTEAAKD